MRHYTYNEYDPEHPLADLSGCYVKTVSEQYVRDTYWPYWKQKMCSVYGEEIQPPHYTNTNNPIDFPVSANRDYCFEDCLEDWTVINWAWPVDEPKT